MPQRVWRDPVGADLGGRGVKPALVEGVVAQIGLRAHPEEDRLRPRAPGDLLLAHGDEELWDRDREGAVLVILRRLDALVALVGDDGLLHLEAGAGEVEILDSYSRQLAPAESAIRHQQDEPVVAEFAPVRPLADRQGERGDFVVALR